MTDDNSTGDVITVSGALALFAAAVDAFENIDLESLPAAEVLRLVEGVELLHRRFDHQTDRVAGHVAASGAFGVDGHRTAKAALKTRCRLSGPVAHDRLRSARVLRTMPMVDAAYARGEIPTESARMIARTLSNPRVAEFGPLVDGVFAEQAAAQMPEAFRAWLRDWERVADVDGAEQRAEAIHERRNASLLENSIDSSWTLRGGFGALQGSAMAEIFARFEDAEFAADWAEAKAIHGADTRVEHLRRTPAQRRADALFAIFRRAAAMPDGGREPAPLVNIVVDEETFRESLGQSSDGTAGPPDPGDVGRRRCQTVGGTRVTPSEALDAALAGHVRRVIVDGASTVIDLGRRRRLFTGCSRDAALLQAVLRNRDRLRCGQIGCDAPSHRIQVDHDVEWTDGGATDVANSQPLCGFHNIVKHLTLDADQDPADLWQMHRPE
ncbi:DUF222 domain-containing protein [Actinospongicola halichondriae]|uniref:HNH endonuclease signature motif containing protein n=1 Tax=Actinospongicola halichondriae TaxID=3236844 RepID=UPI003D4CC5B7